MLNWLSLNWIDIVLIAAVTAVVALAVRGTVRERKVGKSPCGCNCALCVEQRQLRCNPLDSTKFCQLFRLACSWHVWYNLRAQTVRAQTKLNIKESKWQVKT